MLAALPLVPAFMWLIRRHTDERARARHLVRSEDYPWLHGGLQSLLRLDPTRGDGCGDRRVIALVQVGVCGRKVCEGAVEDVALAEVRRDRDPIARARMRAGERAA